jgi:hypothetical protein
MRTRSRPGIIAGCLIGLAGLAAQAAAQNEPRAFPQAQQPPMLVGPPLPPATQIEGFRAPLGSVVTVGYEVLGEVAGISVDARELRASTGERVRGVVIEVTVEKVSPEQSYVDVDELPDLLKGMDRLLAVTENPTQFRNFEMHYATKGELELTAWSSHNRGVLFTVEVGRIVKARRERLTAGELQQLRTLVEAAAQKLATLAPDKR